MEINDEDLIPYGHLQSQNSTPNVEIEKNNDGKLILVTAMTPTTVVRGKLRLDWVK